MSAADVNRLGGEVQRHLVALPLFSERVIRRVAAYQAQSFEVPVGNAALELSSRGMLVSYPRLQRGARVLRFHAPADEWSAGPLGLQEPPSFAPEHRLEEIDVFLVPGVGFSRRGQRLGRGGGYYDASLALRKPTAVLIGISFECTLVDRLPVEAHDVLMDVVVTEAGQVQLQR